MSEQLHNSEPGDPNNSTPVEPTPSPAQPAPVDPTPAQPTPAASPAPVAADPHAAHPKPRGLARAFKSVGVRFYALIVCAIVLYSGYLAFNSLAHTVFVVAPVPPRFLEWQGSVDPQDLRKPDAPGISGDAARAPLAHYHRVDKWFQLDASNTCTTAGCHDPLPHTMKMKVPAFTNFHTTFLACTTCHRTNPASPAPQWINITDGAPQQAPAILKLIAYVETQDAAIRKDPRTAQATILPLLRETRHAIGTSASLDDLILQFDATEPGSPVWLRAYDRLATELPVHARGEYAAKLAPPGYAQEMNDMREPARRALALAADSADRKQLNTAIHKDHPRNAVTCLTCHGNQPAAIDFAAAGYAPSRSRRLADLQLAHLMQQIREGQTFVIPKLMEDGDGR